MRNLNSIKRSYPLKALPLNGLRLTSAIGTNPTSRANLMMSADEGGAEVTGGATDQRF
jgi:hypothetical protein